MYSDIYVWQWKSMFLSAYVQASATSAHDEMHPFAATLLGALKVGDARNSTRLYKGPWLQSPKYPPEVRST